MAFAMRIILQNVLETVIVLAEIRSDKSCTMLCDILLDENYDPEIRAGAAWGLGELQNKEAVSTKQFGNKAMGFIYYWNARSRKICCRN